MIGAGILAAVMFWLLETMLHVVWGHGAFTSELWPADANELWMRAVTATLFVLFGVYADRAHRQLRRTRTERDIANADLAAALEKVLRGFIPICASCKRVHVDGERWMQVESYVRDRTAAEFSHTICPACMDRLYPGAGRPGEAGEPS
jgi:hypothetical protein